MATFKDGIVPVQGKLNSLSVAAGKFGCGGPGCRGGMDWLGIWGLRSPLGFEGSQLNRHVEQPSRAGVASTSYRPDIDGLRAVAVVAVISYHYGVWPFAGGFVGVDVFFVISGFLITTLIWGEIETTGTFRFQSFFLRRSKRLLPALAATLAICLVAGFLIMGPEHFEALAASTVFAATGTSNVHFWLLSGYFDSASDLKPLLHTWSLSVEAQFYLVWPMVLLACARFLPRKRALISVVLVGLVGLAAAQHFLRVDRGAVFYLTPFRVSEFVVGAAMVWVVRLLPASATAREATLILGLAMIVTAALAFNSETQFPGLAAMLPCIGAGLAIYGGEAKWSGRLLRNRGTVAIGKLSYSLYLIHWPALVFCKYYVFRDLTGSETAALLGFSLVAAGALYFGVERPFRSRARISSRAREAIRYGMLVSIVAVPAAVIWAADGMEFRAGGQRVEIPTGYDGCDYPVCYYGDPEKVDFVVVGDSHARHLYQGLKTLAADENLSFAVFHLDPYCRFLNEAAENEDLGYDCSERLDQFLEYMQSHQVRALLFAHRWRDVRNAETQTDRRVARPIEALLADEHLRSVIRAGIVLNVPEFYRNRVPQSCVAPGYLIPSEMRRCEQVETEAFYHPTRELNAAIESHLHSSMDLILDPFEALCENGNCLQKDGAAWIYSDAHHLSAAGAMRFTSHFRQALLGFMLRAVPNNPGSPAPGLRASLPSQWPDPL